MMSRGEVGVKIRLSVEAKKGTTIAMQLFDVGNETAQRGGRSISTEPGQVGHVEINFSKLFSTFIDISID